MTNSREVLIFDIDNTLYSKHLGVAELMSTYIKRYIEDVLVVDDETAQMLQEHYYRDFGLALEGLARFDHIDPFDYNARVDDALPLDNIIKPDKKLREFFERIDRSKVKIWLFTNAYVKHGRRVTRLLGIDEFFDGITFCDYEEKPLVCKPKKEMYDRCEEMAEITDHDKVYFIDDSVLNTQAAIERGWKHVVLLDEDNDGVHQSDDAEYKVGSIYDMEQLYPHLFSPA